MAIAEGERDARRGGRPLLERRRVHEPEDTECRRDDDERHGRGAARRARQLAPARRFRTDDLVHALMREAELLRDLPQRRAALVEGEHRVVVGGAPRFRGVEGALVLLAQLLDVFDLIHVYGL